MKKSVKIILIILVIVGLTAGGVGLYLFNMPHRDVQGEDAKYIIEANKLVNEFMENAEVSNAKYLDNVVSVLGTVAEISEDQLKQKVVLLKTDEAGVNCTFTIGTNKSAESLSVGDKVKIKGIVRVGASYDEDLDLLEYAILEKCDIIK